jgi:hypothetical protein
VQNARVDLPSGAAFEAVRTRQIGDPVVSLVPVLEAATDVVFRRSGLESHERIWVVVVGRIVLRWKVVRLGFPAATHALGVLVALVHVMRDRTEVVEELAEQVPTLFTLHHVSAKQ